MLRSNELKSKFILSLIITGVFFTIFLLNASLFGSDELQEELMQKGLQAAFVGFTGVFVYMLIASYTVQTLNQRQIDRNNWKRWAVELGLIFIIAAANAYIITTFIDVPSPPESIDVPMRPVALRFFINFLMGLLLFAIVEMWVVFEENRDLQISLANAEKEKVASQLLALQQKINPHFLFNSLSVLSELIYDDPKKANDFIREFAKVYRYVLEFSEETLVSVKKELAFLDAYLFLQKIRFGESLQVKYHLDSEVLEQHIPPLSLQLLFENAIKHNQISKANPLSINLAKQNGHLVVTNNLHLRTNAVDSRGVGLSNLKKTYQLISVDKPEFYKTNVEFVAKLPLISNE